MSILIRGMEMPKNCKSCPLRYSSTGYAWCDITGASLALEIDMRDYTCPLVEIPTPHGRLIDATFEENHYASMFLDPTPDVTEQDKHKARIVIDALRMAKTVIEAEGSET